MLKRPSVALLFGIGIYALAWFVPVIDDGATLADGRLPGWEAFRVAISTLWPYEDFSYDGWFSAFIGTVTGLTNVWFLLAVIILLRGPHSKRRIVGWGLLVAALVNTYWLVMFFGETTELRLGYYLWLGSFAVVAASALLTQPGQPESAQAATI